MRSVVLTFWSVLVLGRSSGVDAASAEADADVMVRCAAKNFTPINDGAEIPLKDIVRGANVVALGEPAHGGHEPLQLRNRIIQDLVENLGFTAVALETSFAESEPIYDFVAQEKSQSTSGLITRDNLSWGFGEYAENEGLISWLSDYNKDSLHRRKVHFYGVDLSGSDRQGGFSNARAGVDHALDVLQLVEPSRVQKIRSRLQPLLDHFSDKGYDRLSVSQDKLLENTLQFIGNQLQHKRRELTARIAPEAYEWTLQEIVAARRLQAYFRAAPVSSLDGDELEPDGYLQEEVRDAGMAETVQWILAQEGPRGRVIVFAHNGHVMNSPLRGGIWSAYRRAPRTMGQRLRSAFGNRIAIIGTLDATFGDSTEAVLGRAGKAPFALSLHNAACETPAAAWLSKLRPIRANLDTHFDVELYRAFDAIIILDRITPAHHRDEQQAVP